MSHGRPTQEVLPKDLRRGMRTPQFEVVSDATNDAFGVAGAWIRLAGEANDVYWVWPADHAPIPVWDMTTDSKRKEKRQ